MRRSKPCCLQRPEEPLGVLKTCGARRCDLAALGVLQLHAVDTHSGPALLAPGTTIRAEDIELTRPGSVGAGPSAMADGASLGDIISSRIAGWFDSPGGEEPRDLYHRLVAEIERPLVELALKRAGGNQVKAARMLGLNRNTLRKKITDHKIVLTKFPAG